MATDNKNESDKELLARLQSIVESKDFKEKDNKQKTTIKLNKDMAILGVIVLLVVVSGIQTMKLSGLQVNAAGSSNVTSSAPSGGSGSALPASLDSLPSQVGGC